MKLTQEKKNQAIEIAISGGNPIAFLAQDGTKNPTAAWYAIKQDLKEEDPDTYNRLPDLRKRKKTEQAAAEEKTTEKLELEGGKNYELKVTETEAEDDGYDIAAVRKEGLGEFYYDIDHGTVDWRNPYGDEVILTPGVWRYLAEELPKVLKKLRPRMEVRS